MIYHSNVKLNRFFPALISERRQYIHDMRATLSLIVSLYNMPLFHAVKHQQLNHLVDLTYVYNSP